ncbi:hypothetical protein ACFFNY_23780 [Paenibacillus hodogayensis]|uniref:Uncharacterized protein n=1 Tax=Paenibacillus hodogayensis TaxID=279208 RepID=A0ABV5W241_9BACL
MLVKFAATWLLLIVSCISAWWMYAKEKGIEYSWLAFLIPALFQLAMGYWLDPGHSLSYQVFGWLNFALFLLSAAAVWYLIQLAKSYKN